MLINNSGVNSVYVPILGEKYFVYASLMKMQGISWDADYRRIDIH